MVTGRPLNWPLSEKTNRNVLNVSVSYGTNTDLALELLLQGAQDHPFVLVDPPPISSFEGFGDSCLYLVLRCYLTSAVSFCDLVASCRRTDFQVRP